MAEDKKGRQRESNRSLKKVEPKKKVSKKKESSSFSLRSEIKGLLIMVIAIVALLGMSGIHVGSVGEMISGIFHYGFGLGGWIVSLWVLYIGWTVLYHGFWPKVTKSGLLYGALFLSLVTHITLWTVDEGRELLTTTLADHGGLVGGFLGMSLRGLLGNIGGIIVNSIVTIVILLGITKFSLRLGLHKATDQAKVGIEKAQETALVIKEHVQEWQEERRSAYDREKDTRFPKEPVVKEELEENEENIEDGSPSSVEGIPPIIEVITPSEVAPVLLEEEAVIERIAPSFIESGEETIEPLTEEIDESIEGDSLEYDKYESFVSQPWESMNDNEDMVEEEYISVPTAVSDEEVAEEVAPEVIEPPTFLQESTYVAPLVEVPTIETTKEDTAAVAVSTDDGPRPRVIERPYQFPPLHMLSQGQSNPVTSEEVAHNAALLEETLDNFGITAKVVNATQGPTVTRYELEPAKGTKVSRIMGLQDDLKMSLAAVDIRMEAPIPGKSAVGIEIPNKNVSAVHLRDVLDCDEFKQASGGIPVGLGKDIADMPVITDLAKMPHLLVAGSTGSGKSVCVNTLISSILFSRKPDEVKLILVDPKMVELSVYNGIPHLMLPVVTDMNKAASVLRWAVREMDARYLTLATAGVRNIASYNKQNPTKAMPLILIIIDELADLMMTNPDVEESIDRLAAKARAAGIHMVLATQRPSVDVITGKIKANVPSRIAFTVATQVDSRTILDQAGAERLLGRGDMLFNPIGANKPIRIQGAFISDEEVEEVIAFVKGQGQPEYDEAMMAETEQGAEESEGFSSDEEQDELLERAVQVVLEQRSASVSVLQRRLRVGYSRAGRLIDTMQDMNIVGPPTNSSKGRDILMGADQIRALYFPNFTVD